MSAELKIGSGRNPLENKLYVRIKCDRRNSWGYRKMKENNGFVCGNKKWKDDGNVKLSTTTAVIT